MILQWKCTGNNFYYKNVLEDFYNKNVFEKKKLEVNIL